MRDAMIMRRSSRLLAAALLLGFASALGGCGSISAPSWDPSDLLDFLDTKKRAPGERKPVFPEGVPGISQGVPKELVRGSPESRAASDAQAAAAAQPPAEAQPPARPNVKGTKTAAKRPPAQESQVEIAPDDVNVDEAPPPSPPPRRQTTRARSTTAPEPQANPFPAPTSR